MTNYLQKILASKLAARDRRLNKFELSMRKYIERTMYKTNKRNAYKQEARAFLNQVRDVSNDVEMDNIGEVNAAANDDLSEEL